VIRLTVLLIQDDQRRVGLGELADGPKSTLERLVDVEGRAGFPYGGQSTGLGARIRERASEPREEPLRALARRLDLRDLTSRRAAPPGEEDDPEREQEHRHRQRADACPSRPLVE
jgi:hypothetical protein